MAAPPLAAQYEIDCPRTRIVVHTGTEGILSPLAHDLEIEAHPSSGRATDLGTSWTASLAIERRSFRVVGAMKRGRVDPRILSDKDRAAIERRLHDEVLGFARQFTIEAKGTARNGELSLPRARGDSFIVPMQFGRLAGISSDVTVEGSCELSLRAMGVGEVRGPLNSFRVADRVHISFTAVWKLVAPGKPV
jgi:hypothetical protein